MEYVDKPFGADVHILDPQTAFMAGKIKTTNIDDLRMFERAFPAKPEVLVNVAKQQQEKDDHVVKTTDDIPAKDKADLLFLKVLPMCFVPANAGDWETNIHFKVTGAADYTISVANGACAISEGLLGEPDTVIESEYDDFRLILRHIVLRDSTLVSEDQLEEWDDDIELDMELEDDQLEAIAGGKGCGAEASAGTACGADGCGAAAGAGVACGAAACGADASAGTACGAAACGAAVGVGSVCGADACAAAAGVGTACGAAIGVGACAGDACGAALGAGVCAGNVCGVDILGGADCGPCAINVIPLVPGT